MYPDGAHELEHKFEQAFGDAAMGVAYAYLFQKVRPKPQRVPEGFDDSPTRLYSAFMETVKSRGARAAELSMNTPKLHFAR